jgi:hypothetical protein
MNIHIERVDTASLARCNTNNYPVNAGPNPPASATSFAEELSKTSMEKWVDSSWTPLQLSARTLNILKRFNEASWKCGRLSTTKDNFDELWSCVPELSASGLFDKGHRWFFRFAHNSPRDGAPPYPVLSEYDVLEKIATSGRATHALRAGNNTLYFKSFRDDIDVDNELRVFIHERRITAISTYVSDPTKFTLMSEGELECVAQNVHNFWRNLTVRDRLPNSYTMDVHISGDRVELIEFNSFGYWLAAGSCLFDWIDDYAVLYGDGENVVFRVCLEVL